MYKNVKFPFQKIPFECHSAKWALVKTREYRSGLMKV